MATFIIKYWLEIIFSMTVCGFSYIFKLIVKDYRRLKTEQVSIVNAIKALLKDRILQSANYYREEGFCSPNNLEIFESLYEEYRQLGGGGAIDTLVKEIHALPREKV